jgi:hypothetical protein
MFISAVSSDARTPGRGRGGWTIAVIFAVGLLFLGGLYLTAWKGVPPVYKESKPGTPPTPVRIASWNFKWQGDVEAAVGRLRAVNADVILLQQVSRKDAQAIGTALEMKHGGTLQMAYSPGNPGTTEEPGNAVLARVALFKPREMPAVGGRHYGVLAEAIVDGRRFWIGSIDMSPIRERAMPADQAMKNLIGAWEKGGKSPMIVGGVIAADVAPLTMVVADAGQGFLFTADWKGLERVETPGAEEMEVVIVRGK